MDQTINTNAENQESRKSVLWPVLVGGVFVALAGTNAVLFNRVDTLKDQVAQNQAASAAEIDAVKQAAAASAQSAQQSFAELSTHVDSGAKTATAAAQRASQIAQRNAEKMVRELAAQQKASDEQISKAIGEVRTVTDEHTAKVTGLESSVGTVKEEVSQTRSTLDQTISDLKSTRGDLGVQSGLIATNAKELAALRELGDRQYYEFTIRKGAGPAKVGNMTVELKKADTKRNKYNVQIVADDKTVEKKDRTINEPVQMYVNGNRQPYEIVVNDVQKNAIVGYLAVPKVLQSRR